MPLDVGAADELVTVVGRLPSVPADTAGLITRIDGVDAAEGWDVVERGAGSGAGVPALATGAGWGDGSPA